MIAQLYILNMQSYNPVELKYSVLRVSKVKDSGNWAVVTVVRDPTGL